MAMDEHYNIIQGLDRLFSLHAQASIVAGQADAALEDIGVMFRLDDGLKDEPILRSQAARLTEISTLLQTVGQGLAKQCWPPSRLQSLQERLQKMDLLAPMMRSWYGKRDICINQLFDHGALWPEGFLTPSMVLPFLRGWTRFEQVNLNRQFHDTVFPRINLSNREINPEVNQSINLVLDNSRRGPLENLIDHTLFASFMIRQYSRFAELTAIGQSEVDLAMLACALERYRQAHGQYPETLDALVPHFVRALPHDIVNGQPLKYRRTASGRFILYSVGWNGTDDGGKMVEWMPGAISMTEGDWSWQYAGGN